MSIQTTAQVNQGRSQAYALATPEFYTLNLYRYSDGVFTFIAKDPQTKKPMDLTGKTLNGAINKNGGAGIALDGLSIVEALGGKFKLKISKELVKTLPKNPKTVGFDRPGNLGYYVNVNDGSDDIRVLYGTVFVQD